MIKQLGRWRSGIIAQGYIENSLLSRQLIFDGIVQENAQKRKDCTSTFNRQATHCMQETNFAKSPTGTTLMNILPANSFLNGQTINCMPRPSAVQSATGTAHINILPSTSFGKSTNATIINVPEKTFDSNDFNFQWDDFAEDFPCNNLDKTERKYKKYRLFIKIPKKLLFHVVKFFLDKDKEQSFVSASNKIIPVKESNNTKLNFRSKQKFSLKSPVKIKFIDQSSAPPVDTRKRKVSEESSSHKDENYKSVKLDFKKPEVKFENCTFNNCTINMDPNNNGNKENIN